MTDSKSEKSGAKQSIIIILIAVFIAEFIWMLNETHGDFANGILFYIEHHFNIFFVLFYPILFISTYLLGKTAGKDILELKKGIFITSLKCAILSALIITVYLIIFTLIYQSGFLPILTDGLVLFLIFFITWLCTTSILSKGQKKI